MGGFNGFILMNHRGVVFHCPFYTKQVETFECPVSTHKISDKIVFRMGQHLFRGCELDQAAVF